jgi:hypothetical protein
MTALVGGATLYQPLDAQGRACCAGASLRSSITEAFPGVWGVSEFAYPWH